KPTPRWRLLIGKYVGVVFFVGSQAALFIVLTWLALGIRTGIWDMRYWWCIPFLLLEFAVFYSFSVFLGVLTRSTVACVFGSLLFWLLAWAINFGSAMAPGHLDSDTMPSSTTRLAQAAYWISPKPIDAGLVLFNALGAEEHFDKPIIFKIVEAQGFSPLLSILSSVLLAAALLALSAYEFRAKDY
ncbi:MAG TPA: hypothetical protein VGZ47_19770, partial [Gemmataceae bacterium]|nr:hypothetical protein [Gemmataceae bacterium]